MTQPDQLEGQRELLDRLCVYLKDQFSCDTAILYGSRSRGDWDSASDIDVLAFTSGTETGHVAHRWEGLFLDLFLYIPATKPDRDWLRIHDGRVLFQNDKEGDELLADVKDMFSSGPKLLEQSDLQSTRLWLEKMLSRSQKGDVEGNYRLHWLLKEALEIYFILRGRWYLGPKTSLASMRSDNLEHFGIFEKALAPGARIEDIKAMVNIVNQTS